MRKTKEATAQSRQAIVTEASRLYRERGFEGVGVADIMDAAGMTHGGFYRHFPSKEALITEAMASVFASYADELQGEDGHASVDRVRAYVETYLSPEHVAHPELGCPFAALGGEASHFGGSVAQAFREGAERIVQPIAQVLADKESDGRQDAARVLCMLLGAVVVARASGDADLQAEIMDSVRSDPMVRKLLKAKQKTKLKAKAGKK